MIELFTSSTANGQKVSIMLEECGLEYRTHIVDLKAGDHLAASFLAMNPAGKIPVITDSEGPDGEPFTLTQTSAIALYLAEKTGRLLPADPRERAEAYRYMALVASDVSAAFSGIFIFSVLTPEPAPASYFITQAERQLRVLDQRLGESRYLAGEAYSIADVLAYPVAASSSKLLPRGIADYPALKRWADEVGARPAVRRGMEGAITA
jgi:GST-like protein